LLIIAGVVVLCVDVLICPAEHEVQVMVGYAVVERNRERRAGLFYY
jgi:hypothetical protein